MADRRAARSGPPRTPAPLVPTLVLRRRLVFHVGTALALLLLVLACGGQPVDPGTAGSAPSAPPSVAAPVAPVTPSTPSHWVTVKYRSAPVDVGAPRFEHASGGYDWIDGGWYDAENRHLVMGINGTNYRSCGVPAGVWASVSGMTMGEYRAELRGEYDCRRGGVPGY